MTTLKLNSVAGDSTAAAAEGSVFQRRKVFFYSAFTPHSIRELTTKLMYLDKKSTKDIYLYINSPGGYVTDFLAIYDVIQMLESRVITVGVGLAASCAAFLLMSGTPKCRVAYANARILFHQPSGGFYGTEAESKVQLAELSKLKEILANMMIKHSTKKLTKKTVLDILSKDTYLSAAEAKRLGFIDVIHGEVALPVVDKSKKKEKPKDNK